MAESTEGKSGAGKKPAWADIIPDFREKPTYPPFEELTKVIFGSPKVGKTSWASKCPHNFFIATEPGHDFLSVPVKRIYRWAPDPAGKDNRADFQSLIRALYEAKKSNQLKFKTATVDIVDNLYAMCLTHVCSLKGLEYPPETDFGKTWKEIREEWEKWIRATLEVVSLTFITHCTTENVTLQVAPGVKKEVERRAPTFKGNKAAQFLDGIVNCMGYVHVGANNERYITFKADSNLATGDRSGLLEELGVMPLDWGVVSEAYSKAAKEKGIKIQSRWA
jgi:hypothetical protein